MFEAIARWERRQWQALAIALLVLVVLLLLALALRPPVGAGASNVVVRVTNGATVISTQVVPVKP